MPMKAETHVPGGVRATMARTESWTTRNASSGVADTLVRNEAPGGACAKMIVRVVDAGNHDALQVDHARADTDMALHGAVGTDEHQSLADDGHRLGPRMLRRR
jgi:hypothetical protein